MGGLQVRAGLGAQLVGHPLAGAGVQGQRPGHPSAQHVGPEQQPQRRLGPRIIGAGQRRMEKDIRRAFAAGAIDTLQIDTRAQGEVRRYKGKAEVPKGAVWRTMDCLDCHNRPAHTLSSTPAQVVEIFPWKDTTAPSSVETTGVP